MTKESGSNGGTKVFKKYGRDFFSKIGKLGWEARKKKYTEDELYWQLSKAGEKGGGKVFAKHGYEFYRRIGKLSKRNKK